MPYILPSGMRRINEVDGEFISRSTVQSSLVLPALESSVNIVGIHQYIGTLMVLHSQQSVITTLDNPKHQISGLVPW